MRFRPFGLLLSGVVIASSACSTDATAPSTLSSAGRARGDLGTYPSDPIVVSPTDLFAGANGTSYTVMIDPQVKNVLHFGEHTLVIPARAVCVRTAGYGLGIWDEDCKTEKDPVTITALVRATDAGIPRIDFSPEMRFSPKQAVMLLMHVPNLTPDSPGGSILYCATESTLICVDEAAIDPALQTYRDYDRSSVYRRIKHFSGYFVEW